MADIWIPNLVQAAKMAVLMANPAADLSWTQGLNKPRSLPGAGFAVPGTEEIGMKNRNEMEWRVEPGME